MQMSFKKITDWYASDGKYNICKICLDGSFRYELWRLPKAQPDQQTRQYAALIKSYTYGQDNDEVAKKVAYTRAVADAKADQLTLGQTISE